MLLKLRELFHKLLNIDRRIMILGAAAFLALLAIAAAGLISIQSTNFELLYGDMSPEDSRQVARFLDDNAVDFDLRNNGADVYVDTTAVSQTRILLAQEGLPSRATIGYEVFDDQSSFGTSNLVQEVNRVRALEGELSRTILAIDNVQQARVHIVMPRRELFSRERLKPTASVVVTSSNNAGLDGSQVQAILHVVATSVPELKTEDITVADDRGQLLARGGQGLGQFGGRTPVEIQVEYETRLARQLESILENIVGYGKVRAEIRAEMDFSQQVINKEIYDPDGQVVRSEENIEETGRRVRIPDDPVTVQNNIPENDLVTAPQPGETEENARTEERINYEISSEKTNTVVPPGQLDRLSVAVLVDGTYQRDANGARVYEPRNEEQMQEIERLVKSAIGYNTIDRRDQVEVVNLQFSTSETLGTQLEPLVFGLPAGDFRQLIEALVLAVVILLIAFWVVRPLWARLMGEAQDEYITQIGADGRPILINKRTGLPMPALAGTRDGAALESRAGNNAGGALTEVGAGGVDENEGDEEYAQLVNLQARIRSNIVKQLNAMVEKYPTESSNIVREWVSQK